MRYLVYDSQAKAMAAVDAIDARARIAYHAYGYDVDASGAIVGKRSGCDDQTGVTITWDVPRAISGDRWVIAHPESHGDAAIEVSSGVTLADYVLQDCGEVTISDPQPDWWPDSNTP